MSFKDRQFFWITLPVTWTHNKKKKDKIYDEISITGDSRENEF